MLRGMQITLVNQTRIKFSDQALQMLGIKVVTALRKIKNLKNKKRLSRSDLTVVLLSSARMKKVNLQFRGKDYVTDVLSFAPTSRESVGELLFCPSVLKKQARLNQHSLDNELTYLLIHGILHLLGYDHERSKAAEKKMFLIQDRLFSRLTAAKINLKLVHVHRRRVK